MNKTQKLILAIFVPIIFFFIALVFANSVGVTEITRKVPENLTYLRRYLGATTGNPFDWGRTWCVWFVYSASCCLFEFLLFRDNKKINNKKI